jgi:tripartite-type tricarboxylate transporter receptor subunit TctC
MIVKPARRAFLHLAARAAALPALARVAGAQTYPARPVRLLVGFAAGGPSDISARLIGQWLSERLGQSFIIENRPGAGGNLATEAVVRASPDGYTLLETTSTNAWNTALYHNLTFDFSRDIVPVAGVCRYAGVIVVNPSVPATSVPELIAYAKANPGRLNMGSGGAGTPSHLYGELFKKMTGIDLLHVPFRGGGPAVVALLAGQVQIFFGTVSVSIDHIRSGRLRALGVTTRTRMAAGGRADRRFRARLRGKRLGRHRRAQEHARGNHRYAQQGSQCGPGRCRFQVAPRQPGSGGVRDVAGRSRPFHRRLYRKVGQADPDSGHQRGMMQHKPGSEIAADDPKAG